MKGGESTGFSLDMSGMNMAALAGDPILSTPADAALNDAANSILNNYGLDTPISYESYDPLSSFSQTPTQNVSAPTTTYRVQPGDTLSGIARDAGISLQELKDLNPKFETDPKYQGGNMIWSGTTVKLPGQISAPIAQQPVEPPPPPPPINPSGGTIIPPSGGTESTFTYTYVEPTPPAPVVEPVIVSPPPPQVKTAQPDIIIFDDDQIPAEIMTNLVLEDIGGHELINIARHDTVNGQNIAYQPIKDLSIIQQRNNPNNVINLQQTEKQYFLGFPIDLNSKIPEEGNGLNGDNFYINVFGDLIVEFINLKEDERVEVEVIQNDIIYSIDSEE